MLTGLALTFTSCGDDEEDDATSNNGNEQQNNNGNNQQNNNSGDNNGNNSGDNNGNGQNTGNQTIDASIKGFIPNEYQGKKVVAWYFCENVDPTKNKPEGVYAFDDGSVVVTSIENGTKLLEFYGKYTLTGDYENGTITITVMGIKAAEMKIEKGIIGEPQGRYSYIKQDNSKIPAYAKADKDEMMDDGQHGEDIDQIIEPFLPVQYADKKVAAWYANTNIENDRTKTESVFLFDDGTVVKTTYKYKTHNNSLQREVDFVGLYSATGTFSNGTVAVKSVTGETLFEVTISNGVLVALAMGNATFKQQDNSKLPQATNETAQGDYGGNENGNEGNGGNETVSFQLVMKTIDEANYTATGCYAEAYIDGFSGRTDIDPTKIGRIGFCVRNMFALGEPTVNDMVFTCKNGIGKGGGFDLLIESNDLKDGDWLIRAFVEYDGEITYSYITHYFSTKNNGGDDDDDDSELVEAFLPTSYADKDVEAWYEYHTYDEKSGKYKILAIFIFNDNSLVVTKAKYNLFDSNATREIEYTGFCELNEGDYQDGIVYADNGMTIKIVDGIITIPNEDGSTEEFEWQFLDDLPTPTDATK